MKRKPKTPMKAADELFSILIRSVGYCQLKEGAPHIECKGYLQCCHIISRDYKAIRCDLRNALCGCAAHHYYFTNHGLEWERWIRSKVGDALYDELREKALTYERQDWAQHRRDLKVRLVAMGIPA